MKDFFINFKSYLHHIGLWLDPRGENWQNIDFGNFQERYIGGGNLDTVCLKSDLVCDMAC